MSDFAPGPSPTIAPPSRRRRQWPLIVAIVILAAGLAAALVWPRSGDATPAKPAASATPVAAATFSITGMLTLSAGDFMADDSQLCWGNGGYDDLSMGTSVTITDAAGTVVGVGQVNSAHNDGGMGGTCDLSFKVDGVPTGKGFYGIEVSHRGSVKKSEADLKAGSAELTIG